MDAHLHRSVFSVPANGVIHPMLQCF